MRIRGVIRLFAAAFVLSRVASAQLDPNDVPQALGPLGGSASSLAIDPVNPNIVLVIKYTKGLFRSTDGGNTFDTFGDAPLDIRDLTPDPQNQQTLFVLAGTQVLKSTDFGSSWSPLPFTSIENLKSLSIATTGNGMLATDAFNVYRSTDNGLTWPVVKSVVPFAGEVIEDAIYAPSNPTIAYCTSNKGVYKSTTGGASFFDPGPYSLWTQAVTVSPTNPNLVFTGTPFNGVHRSTDGGVTFIPVGTGLALTGNAEFFKWSPNGSKLWFTVLTGVVSTSNLGNTWDDENLGLPPSNPPIPLSMAYDSLGNVFLGCEGGGLNDQSGGGLYTRQNGVAPWVHLAFLEVSINVVAIAAPGSTRIAGLGGGVYSAPLGGILTSTAWHYDIGTDTRALAVDPTDSTRWVTGGVGAFFDNAQIVVLTQNGAQFVKTYEKYGSGVVSDIAFDPSNSNRVVAGMYPADFGNKAIIVSTNKGNTWTEINGTAGWATRSIAFDPLTPGRVVQLSENNQWSASANGGNTWLPLQPAWPASGAGVFVAFDPFKLGVLYRGDTVNGLWRSDNSGANWIQLGITLSADSDIEFHPDVPGMFWITDDQGFVLLTTDRGANFVQSWDVHLEGIGTSMALDRGNGSLLVGTNGASLWELPGASPFVRLGPGTPGVGGFVPRQYPTGGLSNVGNAAFGIGGDRIRGGAPILFFLGLAPIAVPAIGGTFYVGSLVGSVGFAVTGTPGSPGAGQFNLPIPLPAMPGLAGFTVVSQYAVADAASGDSSGYVLSDGLSCKLLP